jgi:hypothetical protein
MPPEVTICPVAYATGYVPAALMFRRDYPVSATEKIAEFQRLESALHMLMDTSARK